jgi:hypothetical protein
MRWEITACRVLPALIRPRAAAEQQLDLVAAELGGQIETNRGPHYLYFERKAPSYPAREEYFPVAPAHVQTKARYGTEWFQS